MSLPSSDNQVILNYQRQSTSGWQIWNILLDFSGGMLSILQLVGDSLAEARAQGRPHEWTGVIGNPAKFGLGLVSIFFDVSNIRYGYPGPIYAGHENRHRCCFFFGLRLYAGKARIYLHNHM